MADDSKKGKEDFTEHLNRLPKEPRNDSKPVEVETLPDPNPDYVMKGRPDRHAITTFSDIKESDSAGKSEDNS